MSGILFSPKLKDEMLNPDCRSTKSIYLGACLGAVHDGVAPVHGEGVPQLVQTFGSSLITRVNNPPEQLYSRHSINSPSVTGNIQLPDF